MRPIRSCLAALLLLSGTVHAAVDGFTPDLAGVASIPRYAADGASVAKAVAAAKASKSEPLRFAVAAALPLTLSQGAWSISGDTAIWRARMASPGALSLGLEFSKFAVPAGGALYVYDPAAALVQGPYTQAADPAQGRLWTALVQGDEAVIEARMPAASRQDFALTLANVTHGYLDFTRAASQAKALNSLSGTQAGSCEINVACAQGNSWSNEIRSVAAITINNQTVCSGTLVNDIPQDGTPYFLTANHCGISSNTLANSVVFYWNYQATSCNVVGDPNYNAATSNTGSLSQNQSGSSLIAGDVGSDFTLLRLTAKPASSFNTYYAGFDASGAGASSGVGLHHPEGDIKKVSTYSSATTQSQVQFNDNNTTRTVQAWRVGWASGVTEPGSSGSGLWNQNHQIIGVLSGGDSSCTNTTGSDYYGRLGVAWTANSTASGQLKANLDPCNTGSTAVGGANASTLGTGGASCGVSGTTTGSTTGTTTGGTTGNVAAGSSSGSSGGGGALPPMLLMLLPLAWRRRQIRSR